jgi:hypothetical protein
MKHGMEAALERRTLGAELTYMVHAGRVLSQAPGGYLLLFFLSGPSFCAVPGRHDAFAMPSGISV